MAQFDLYIDINGGQLVTGAANSTPAPAPPFVQGDTPTFRIFLLQRTATYPVTPYTAVPIGGLTLEAALGTKVGSGGTIYTQQLAWTPSADPNNPNYWIATFPLNTAAVTTLLGSNPNAPAWFEVKYVSGGVPTTVLQQLMTVQASVIQGAGVVVPPGLTPVSAEFANATFLTRNISGAIYLVNPNTGKKVALYLGDDNTVHEDAVN